MTPTARSLAECRRRGWIAQVVEQTVPRTFIKRDLFGIIDIVAVSPSAPHTPAVIIGIQCTSGSNHSARRAKAKASPALRHWDDAWGSFLIWSWSKKGGRGKRKTWQLREEAVRP